MAYKRQDCYQVLDTDDSANILQLGPDCTCAIIKSDDINIHNEDIVANKILFPLFLLNTISKVLSGPYPTGSLICPGHLEHLLVVCVKKIVCVYSCSIDYMHT